MSEALTRCEESGVTFMADDLSSVDGRVRDSINVGSWHHILAQRVEEGEHSRLLQAASGLGTTQPRAFRICIAVSQEQAKRVKNSAFSARLSQLAFPIRWS